MVVDDDWPAYVHNLISAIRTPHKDQRMYNLVDYAMIPIIPFTAVGRALDPQTQNDTQEDSAREWDMDNN